MRRYEKIAWERFKYRITDPNFLNKTLIIIFLPIVVIVILLQTVNAGYIENIHSDVLFYIILFLQLVVIMFQTFILNEQKKYYRRQYLPNMIVYLFPEYKGESRDEFSVFIKNLGEVAYNISYHIILKGKKEFDNNKKKRKIKLGKFEIKNTDAGHKYTLTKEQKKTLKTFNAKEFLNHEMIVTINYEDMFEIPHEIRFLKLEKESDFVPIKIKID